MRAALHGFDSVERFAADVATMMVAGFDTIVLDGSPTRQMDTDLTAPPLNHFARLLRLASPHLETALLLPTAGQAAHAPPCLTPEQAGKQAYAQIVAWKTTQTVVFDVCWVGSEEAMGRTLDTAMRPLDAVGNVGALIRAPLLREEPYVVLEAAKRVHSLGAIIPAGWAVEGYRDKIRVAAGILAQIADAEGIDWHLWVTPRTVPLVQGYERFVVMSWEGYVRTRIALDV